MVLRPCCVAWISAHGLGVDAYGLLITMVGAPGTPMTIGEIWEKAMPGTVSSPIWPI